MKLLIIDDHSVVREGLAALLRQSRPGVEILEAADGAQGLALVDAHDDLDVAFLDLGLPGEGGLAVAPELGRRRPDLPVIVLSSSEDPADVRKALAAGALGYIPKSATPQTLISALNLVLSGAVYVPPLVLAEAETSNRRGDRPQAPALTARQVEVLRAICQGLSNRDIGVELDMSEKTVKTHVTAIFRALNVVSRTQAVNAARTLGLVN